MAKITVWKNHISETFKDGPIPNTGVGKGGNVQKDLRKLIEYCKRAGGKWHIAKIDCDEKDLEPALEIGEGWYIAKKKIISEEGFFPIDEVEKKYMGSPT